jgi:hypothetical protein
MRLILHIGLPKTGTTGIQKNLFINRKEFKKQGILIPHIGLQDKRHFEFVYSNGTYITPDVLVSRINYLVKQTKSGRYNTIVLSDENFS